MIVATVTPDMAFPATAALLADELGMPDAAAYDLSAGCTGFMYAIAQAYGMLASGLSQRALVVGGDVLSRVLDWTDRSTLVLFGDGAGAVVMEPVEHGGFLGFELGADGGGGNELLLPSSGSRLFNGDAKRADDERPRGVQVRDARHGQLRQRRFSPRVERRWTTWTCTFLTRPTSGSSITRRRSSGSRARRSIVNVDRYGNTSSGSIPLALADAADDGRLEPGKLVLMTGMGAGLTWGSALIEWTHSTTGAMA